MKTSFENSSVIRLHNVFVFEVNNILDFRRVLSSPLQCSNEFDIAFGPSRTRDYLKQLVDEGVLEIEGEYKNRKYKIKKK